MGIYVASPATLEVLCINALKFITLVRHKQSIVLLFSHSWSLGFLDNILLLLLLFLT